MIPDIPLGGGKLNPDNWHLNKTGNQHLIIGRKIQNVIVPLLSSAESGCR